MDWITGAGKWGVADAGRVNFLIKPCSDEKHRDRQNHLELDPTRQKLLRQHSWAGKGGYTRVT